MLFNSSLKVNASVSTVNAVFFHLISYSSLGLRPVTLIFKVGNILLKIQRSKLSQCVLFKVSGERGCTDSGLREARLAERVRDEI